MRHETCSRKGWRTHRRRHSRGADKRFLFVPHQEGWGARHHRCRGGGDAFYACCRAPLTLCVSPQKHCVRLMKMQPDFISKQDKTAVSFGLPPPRIPISQRQCHFYSTHRPAHILHADQKTKKYNLKPCGLPCPHDKKQKNQSAFYQRGQGYLTAVLFAGMMPWIERSRFNKNVLPQTPCENWACCLWCGVWTGVCGLP